ncbi:unnamed protein product [Urochloa decumbens]|uniref:Response regulatory domain-containing protein n=1 Tax=Urochloa decumbens TaxID=240449 RepID=A0ABC9BSH0_9POAL
MEREMSTHLFPNGVKALIVDNDTSFITTSSRMLSILNFKVDTCGSPTSAMKLLTRYKHKSFDVVLTNAVKAAACGFNFRAIVESDLCIPVFYFLPLNHKAAGNEVNQLLRTLVRSGTYILRQPLDTNDVCDLWRAIACRKLSLDAKAKQAGRGRKRKSRSNPDGSSSGTSLAGDNPAKRQRQMNVRGQERDNLASQQQPTPQQRRGMEPQAMDGRQLGHQQQQQQSLFVQYVLRTLPVPPYNPRIFADAAGSSNNVAACAGASNAYVLPSALAMPPLNPSPIPAPAPRPMYSAPAPRPALPLVLNPSPVPVNPATAPVPPKMFTPFSASYQGQRPPAVQQDMFLPWRRGGSGMWRSETGSTMLSATTTGRQSFHGHATDAAIAYGNAACSLLQSLNLGTDDDHDELPVPAMVTMPTRSNNPPLAPQTSVISNEAVMAELYGNNFRSLMAQRRIGNGVAAKEAVTMGTLNGHGYINNSTAPAMAPEQVGHGVAVAPEEGAGMEMEEILNSNNFSNYSTGSPLAPDQVLGMASYVNELTMAGGGAFGSNNVAAPSMAPQDLVFSAPNGNQLAPGALDEELNGSLMGSQQGPGMAMGGSADFTAMFSADQYEENTMFTLEDLLGLDGQQSGATDGAAAAIDANAAETSLIGGGGEGGMETWGVGAADNFDGDFFLDDLWDLRAPSDVNNGRK